jgi:hypothetical protein
MLCYRAITRLAMLPKDHPLHTAVKQKATSNMKCHRGPLHKLMKQANFNPRNMEKIPTMSHDPSKTGQLPFKISIPEDKESSAEEAEKAEEEIQIFTDGSA